MCQLSRPRPRRVVPIWGRSAVGLGIGLGGSVSDGLAGAFLCTSLVVHKGWPLVLPCTSKVERWRTPREALGHALVLDKVIALVHPLRAYTGRLGPFLSV